jgi:hypothetical protein
MHQPPYCPPPAVLLTVLPVVLLSCISPLQSSLLSSSRASVPYCPPAVLLLCISPYPLLFSRSSAPCSPPAVLSCLGPNSPPVALLSCISPTQSSYCPPLMHQPPTVLLLSSSHCIIPLQFSTILLYISPYCPPTVLLSCISPTVLLLSTSPPLDPSSPLLSSCTSAPYCPPAVLLLCITPYPLLFSRSSAAAVLLPSRSRDV